MDLYVGILDDYCVGVFNCKSIEVIGGKKFRIGVIWDGVECFFVIVFISFKWVLVGFKLLESLCILIMCF